MKPYVLHVLVRQEPGGGWTAHVLDFDIVAGADTEREAVSLLPGLLVTYFESVSQHGNPGRVFRPAPAENWNQFLWARPVQRKVELPQALQLPGCSWEFKDLELGSYPQAA